MSDDRVRLVKDANDIVDVVGGYLALRPSGNTFLGLCPFHDDSRPSFDVSSVRRRYKCWSCGAVGDVIKFVQEYERIGFRDALEMLANRAGINLGDDDSGRRENRSQLLGVMRWAQHLYQQCLLESSLGESARAYLGERGLTAETVREWGLGFAPGAGSWLVEHARRTKTSLELLESVGLIAKRKEGEGYYDRFRDRVQFPIRDARGHPVGFGGRLLPGSPSALKGDKAKYYNSAETPVFSKSRQLYGIDQAAGPAQKAGYLAVVEGYTDVLMAHQAGIRNVVATMGTALNDKHVEQIRRYVKRVVLVYDADEGGDKGVDRALGLFAEMDVELAVTTLPVGLDPCDMLVRDGAEAFKRVLEAARDALEYKLHRMVEQEKMSGVEGRRRVLDAVLGIIARSDARPGESRSVKMELMLTRVAQRLSLPEATVRARLAELRRAARPDGPDGSDEAPPPIRAAKAAPEEKRLLEVLLAEPSGVVRCMEGIDPTEVEHPGLRRLLAGLYGLVEAGEEPTLDGLRETLQDSPGLLNAAFDMQEAGLERQDRRGELEGLIACYHTKRLRREREEMLGRLAGTNDDRLARELLSRLGGNRAGDSGSQA